MTRQSDIPTQLILDTLDYNPLTGQFSRPNSLYPNQVGYIDKDGYLQIGIGGATFRASHLAYIFMWEEPPVWPDTVNHINHCKLDNRWENLETLHNLDNVKDGRKCIRKPVGNRDRISRNKHGYRGVRFHPTKDRFQAVISINGKRKYLGWFLSAEEAGAAYQRALDNLSPST